MVWIRTGDRLREHVRIGRSSTEPRCSPPHESSPPERWRQNIRGSTAARRRYSLRDVNRRYAPAALCLVLVSIWAPIGAHGRAIHRARPTNPVVAENRLAGTDRWDIPWPGYRITDDRRLNIKGYATSTSVPQGGSIGLRITTAEHEPYTIDVYRLGYYDGLGGRHVTRLGPFDGSPQPACVTMPKTGMITCPWTTSVELDVPTTWTSGVYFAVLTTASKFQSEIMFTVLDDRPSDIVFVSSVNTYQAYNNFPYDPPAGVGWNAGAYPLTGRSLYDFNSPTSKKYPDGKPAVKVSFDRPYSSQYGNPGNGGLTDFEPMTIAYLEKHGYDVTYVTDVDVDADPATLLSHKVVLISGHSEYWSKEMVRRRVRGARRGREPRLHHVERDLLAGADPAERRRDARTDRGRVQGLQARSDRRPRRSARSSGATSVAPSRSSPACSSPRTDTSTGVDCRSCPIHTDTWPFEGTGLQDGVPINAELSGYEIDSFDPNYPAPDSVWRLLLARSPFTNFQGRDDFTQNTSLYCAHSGAFVFATGTMDWAWGLAPGWEQRRGPQQRPSIAQAADGQRAEPHAGRPSRLRDGRAVARPPASSSRDPSEPTPLETPVPRRLLGDEKAHEGRSAERHDQARCAGRRLSCVGGGGRVHRLDLQLPHRVLDLLRRAHRHRGVVR